MSFGDLSSTIYMAVFVVGFGLTVGSAYLFLRDRKRSVAGVPLWVPLLITGLAMTLVLPALLLFVGSVAGGEAIGRLANSFIPHAAAQVPSNTNVTCYLPPPPTPTPTFMPPPSCYTGTPPPPSPLPTLGTDALMAIGSLGAAGVATTRGELLEKLHEEGRIPEEIYNKLKPKKP